MGDRGPGGRRLTVAHLTTVDMSLALLLATELRVDVEAGYRVLALSAPGPYVPQVEALGVEYRPVRSFNRTWDARADAAAALELYRLLRAERPDVLHTHTPKAGVIGRVVGRLARVPVVVDTCHGLWLRDGDRPAKRAAVVAVEAAASAFAHFELYQNDGDRRTMRRFVGPRRARVVGNGVDLERFRFDPAGREAVRAELGVGPDELLVGGVGRRVAEKGVQELAAAARALAGRARFVWIGPEEGEALEPEGLTFVGARADMPAVYSALDVFALPSYREGFSRSGMEAAACGRAMVLSDIRGCREVGEHERHLLLVPPADAGALTAALGRLLADAGLRARLGAAAAERAREAFDQRAVARASIDTYRLVAHRRRLGWEAA
ncbi:MAG TPA: glycosyltransferase [Acidimicrobiales bacterium]|nr:glycosyltransferase [Acidimicrobiales bacterium]